MCHVFKRSGAGGGISVVVGAGVGGQCGDDAGVVSVMVTMTTGLSMRASRNPR